MMRTLLAFVGAGVGYLLVLPVIVAGFPFWIVALLTRTLRPWLEPPKALWNELIQFDPVVGWRPKPHLRTFCQGAGTELFYVETDEEGWCGAASLNECPVIVFGDSFAFGYGANAPFFRISTGLRIKAIAAPGYSMVQELMLMMQLSRRLCGKLVVWFIYPGNDLTDNLSPAMWGYRSPFLRESDDRRSWEIVTSHVQPDKWPAQPRYDQSRKLSAVFGRNLASDRVYAACEFLIARGQTVCRGAGASLVVLTIPWVIQFDRLPHRGVNGQTVLDPDLPDKRLGEICKRFGVRFVPGKQHLAKHHYILSEGHLNEAGHRRLAGILFDLYQDHRSSMQDTGWPRSIPVLDKA